MWQESATGPLRRHYEVSGEGVAVVERFARDWAALSESVDGIIAGKEDLA